MDLRDFQRLGILSGELKEEDIIAYSKECVILTFKKGGAAAESEYRGKRVYSVSPEIDGPGTWICNLKPLKDYYQAKAVKHLDAAFFLALKESQKKEIADILWSENHDVIIRYFDEIYAEEVQTRITNAVTESVKPLQAEIEQLQSEKETLTHDLERARHLLASQVTPQATVIANPDGTIQMNTVPVVTRISGDEIHCDLFTYHLYFVHISLDRKKMFIQPHRSGKTFCINGTLHLTNFSNIVPFEGECQLRSEFVPDKGFYVYFD